jgi:hypothetical protein
VQLRNSGDGFEVTIGAQTPSNTERYHILRVKYGSPFTTFSATSKQRTATDATLQLASHDLVVGDIVQVSINDPAFDGIFRVNSTTSTSITYTTETSGTVNQTSISGYVIPTSAGPSKEGTEVFRAENEGTVQVASHTPEISGQKIFITYGEHDMAENIIHLVLA